MKLDGKAIQMAIMQLVEDYKFEPYQIAEIIQMGLRSGFKKDYPEYKKATIRVNIDGEGDVHVYREWEVVATEEEIEDTDKEKLLSEAETMTDTAVVGEPFLVNITPEELELSRIAAQAAAQTVKQHLKVIERERFFEKFQHKQGELLKAKVTRVTGDSVVLDVDATAVVLPSDGQIPNRMYHVGEDIFVLLKQISKGTGGIILDITQSSADYVEAILKKLVPELEDGSVEIVKIARKAGKRCKILVKSHEEHMDPVGVMVGHRGDRINTVLSLLDGEKIDYLEDKGTLESLVADALKPARVRTVELEDNKAYVYLPDDQKGLAIGREAINIKLAGQLSGCSIELR